MAATAVNLPDTSGHGKNKEVMLGDVASATSAHYRTTVTLPANKFVEISAMCNAQYTQALYVAEANKADITAFMGSGENVPMTFFDSSKEEQQSLDLGISAHPRVLELAFMFSPQRNGPFQPARRIQPPATVHGKHSTQMRITSEDADDNDNNDTEAFIFFTDPPPSEDRLDSLHQTMAAADPMTQKSQNVILEPRTMDSSNSTTAHGKLIYGTGRASPSEFQVVIYWDNFVKGSTVQYGPNPSNAFAMCWNQIDQVTVEEDVFSSGFQNLIIVTMYLSQPDQTNLKGLGPARLTLKSVISYWPVFGRPLVPTVSWDFRQHGGNWRIQGVRD